MPGLNLGVGASVRGGSGTTGLGSSASPATATQAAYGPATSTGDPSTSNLFASSWGATVGGSLLAVALLLVLYRSLPE